jgi:hypothetical protein
MPMWKWVEIQEMLREIKSKTYNRPLVADCANCLRLNYCLIGHKNYRKYLDPNN